jgi:hypothetical protein
VNNQYTKPVWKNGHGFGRKSSSSAPLVSTGNDELPFSGTLGYPSLYQHPVGFFFNVNAPTHGWRTSERPFHFILLLTACYFRAQLSRGEETCSQD